MSHCGDRVGFSVEKISQHDVTVTISSSENFPYDLTTDFTDAQSCVTAHGGKFFVVNDPVRGVALKIELPLYALYMQKVST